MNYIELINIFWQTRRICKLSSNEADLYFCLLNESNIRGWENPFECRNDVICSAITMSEKTLIDVRNRLQQKGLITFESGQRKKKSPVYTVLYWSKVSKTDSKTVGITDSKTVSKTPNLLYKHKQETETKEKQIEKPLVFPFSSDLFFEKWNLLVSTPKWKNKLPQSLQIALDSLSKYDEPFVLEMITTAIAGEWTLFKPIELESQYKIYKNSAKTKNEKGTAKNKNFKPPTLKQVTDYCNERKNSVDAQKFIDFYQSKGWMVGKNKMKDWQACVRTWEKETPKSGKPLIDIQALEKIKNTQEQKEKAKQLKETIQKSVLEKLKSDNPNFTITENFDLWDSSWKSEYISECKALGMDKVIYENW